MKQFSKYNFKLCLEHFRHFFLLSYDPSQRETKPFYLCFLLKPNHTPLTNIAIYIAEYNRYCSFTASVILCYHVTLVI